MLLKTPIEVGGVRLANRLAMPPMQTGKTPDGSIGPELAEHYSRRAAGGAVGLVITEHSRISFEGQAGPMQISLASDEEAEAHRLITSALHAAGTKVFAQINHAGSAAPEQFTGVAPVSASAVERRTRDGGVIVPRALTRDGIAEIGDRGPVRGGGAPREERGLRRGGDTLGARLPSQPVLLSAHQPPHRRVRRER